MSDFVNAAKRELDQLEIELRALHEKIRRLHELVAMYEPAGAERQRAERQRPALSSAGNFAAKPTAGASSKAKAMEAAITSLLGEKLQVHRSVILEHLNSAGIMGGEKNPVGHLAAFMSDHRNLFVSDGKGNFRLRTELAVADGGRNGDE